MFVSDTGISSGHSIPKLVVCHCEGLIPVMSALHDPIDHMDELADMVFFSWFSKSFWLLYVDVLFCQTVEVSSDEVDLPEFEIVFDCNSGSHPDRFKLNHSSPSLVVVDTELLCISLSNKPCFVLDSISFTVPFDIIDPYQVHNVCIHQVPCVFLFECVHFDLHWEHPSIGISSDGIAV